MKKIILIISIISFIFSCDKVDEKLIVKNTTSDTVFFYVRNTSEIKITDRPIFYRISNIADKDRYENCLSLNEQEHCWLINDTWEERIDRIPDRKIKIIFFKKQLLDTTKWERIVNEQISSKIIERDVEELKILNWVVEYDGK